MRWRRTLRVALLMLAVLAAASPEVAQAKPATVRLKNGGWVEGDVMSVDPEHGVVVRLADGTVRSLPWLEVAHVEDAPRRPAPADSEPPAAARNDAASTGIPRTWLSVFGFLATGGSAGNSSNNRFTSLPSNSVDLATTFAGGAQLSYAFNAAFALGVVGQYVSWRNEAAEHRSGLLDAAVAPRFQFKFTLNGTPAGVFIQLPVGIGLVLLNDTGVSDVKWKTGPALMFGFNLGLEVFVSPRFGGFASLGWSRHAFNLEVETSQTFTPVKSDVEIDQAMFQLGLSYALSQL